MKTYRRVFDAPSRCSSGQPVRFKWFGYPQAKRGQDYQAVLDKFQAIIQKPNRVTNDFVWAMSRSEVLQRLRVAASGKLRPPSQIKPVDIKNPPALYEIRWQGITVRTRLSDGSLGSEQIIVRMYHSEPSEAPGFFIGHHIHEKDVSDPSNINKLQNDEIKVAVKYFELGKQTCWGIRDLEKYEYV